MRRPIGLRKSHLFMIAILPAAVAASGGCGAGAELQAQAVSDLQCPDEQVHSYEPAYYMGRAKGCGREMVYVWNREEWVSPIKRATFELNCPAEQLVVTPLTDRSAGVTGCGHKVVYVISATGEWVLDSASANPNSVRQ